MMSRRLPPLVFLAMLAPSVFAKPAFLQMYENTIHPPKRIARCFLCHRVERQSPLNPYGEAVRLAGISANGFQSTLNGAADADEDGVSNADEVKFGTFPGNAEDLPGHLIALEEASQPKGNGASGSASGQAKVN